MILVIVLFHIKTKVEIKIYNFWEEYSVEFYSILVFNLPECARTEF